MPMANLTTEGSTTTHLALSRRSWGTLSGTSRISLMTFPEFSTRSCSFFASANATAARNEKPIRATQILFIGSLHSLRPYGEYTQNSGRDRQTPRGDADSDRRPIIKQKTIALNREVARGIGFPAERLTNSREF